MKEITRIHLARTPFNIEVEARKALEKYLTAIEKALNADDDTMREIEARVIEILAERGVSAERAITMADEKAVEARLGSPSDFVDESEAEPATAVASDKRLMRDSERGLLGGVCAGIAGYFGINVMWPRLVAILLICISFGTAMLVYAVLWLVIPSAKTAAEKLQMRGEPVTLAALKEKASETVETPERSKPLVVVLRVLLGLAFAVAGLVAAGLTITMLFASDLLFGRSPHLFDNVAVAYVAAIAAGLLFAILMTLASYASFAWTINRKLLISGSIVIILGLTSAAAMVVLGVRGSNQLRDTIEASKTTETTSGQLSLDTRRVTFDMPSLTPVEYHVKAGVSSIEVHYFRGLDKPKVAVVQDNDQATVSLASHGECPLPFGRCSVVIYGPALSAVTVKSGSVTYLPTAQDQLAVNVGRAASLSVNGGSLGAVSGEVAGTFDGSDASISKVSLSADVVSSLAFGSLDSFTLTTPKLCTTGRVQVSYQSANSFTINGVPVTNTDSSVSCVQFDGYGG